MIHRAKRNAAHHEVNHRRPDGGFRGDERHLQQDLGQRKAPAGAGGGNGGCPLSSLQTAVQGGHLEGGCTAKTEARDPAAAGPPCGVEVCVAVLVVGG